jgi:hypothetical protein
LREYRHALKRQLELARQLFERVDADPVAAFYARKCTDWQTKAPPSESLTTSLFSTHPDTRERIALLEKASAPSPATARPPSPDFAALRGVFPYAPPLPAYVMGASVRGAVA